MMPFIKRLMRFIRIKRNAPVAYSMIHCATVADTLRARFNLGESRGDIGIENIVHFITRDLKCGAVKHCDSYYIRLEFYDLESATQAKLTYDLTVVAS